LTAEGSKQKLTLEGEGEAAAIKAKLIAKGEGLKEQVSTLGVDAESLIAAEVADSLAASSNTKFVLGADGLVKAVSHIADAFGNK
jgi:hypothetical protein